MVIGFGTNRKLACDFLLDRHSNLGPILLVSEILQVFCSDTDPNSILFKFFRVFSLDQIADVGVKPSINLKLRSREIIFRHIRTYVIAIPERYRRTVRRQTDRRTIFRGITALCVALCGKIKRFQITKYRKEV